jgi:hypothetical protein
LPCWSARCIRLRALLFTTVRSSFSSASATIRPRRVDGTGLRIESTVAVMRRREETASPGKATLFITPRSSARARPLLQQRQPPAAGSPLRPVFRLHESGRPTRPRGRTAADCRSWRRSAGHSQELQLGSSGRRWKSASRDVIVV